MGEQALEQIELSDPGSPPICERREITATCGVSEVFMELDSAVGMADSEYHLRTVRVGARPSEEVPESGVDQ